MSYQEEHTRQRTSGAILYEGDWKGGTQWKKTSSKISGGSRLIEQSLESTGALLIVEDLAIRLIQPNSRKG